MLKFDAQIATMTYNVGNGFMIDVVNLPDEFEAWIYHKKYGVKSLMFGLPKEDHDFDEFLDCVRCDITNSKVWYMEEVMKGEEI